MTNCLKGQRTMKTATLALRRLLTMALGALGLGALTAGTALGQTAGEGNIPAPNIFDDQITCSMLVPSMTPMPSVIPMGAMESPLDTLIGMGTTEIDTTATGTGTYEDLGYVIPPGNNNCGFGATGPTLGDMNNDANDDGDFLDAGDTLAWGDVPKDVADGYSALLPLFEAVYGNPGGTTGGTARALTAAQKALSDAVTAGTTGPALTVLQDAVTAAQTAHNKAMANFNAASGGPIYQAGVAEWMAKAAVTKSVMDYNMQVAAANMAKTTLDEMDYGSYVPLGNDELITTVVTFDATGVPTVVGMELEQYANADPGAVETNSGTIGMDGVTVTSGGNFTTTGQLIVPMSLQDHDGDSATDEVLRPVVATTGNRVDEIRTRVERVNAAAKALEKLRDDNVNPVLQGLYNEAARRARLEADYYNAEWAEVLADNTNQNTVTTDDPSTPNVNEAAPFSIASRNAAYTAAENKRFAAEQDVRSKVAAREAATAHVRGQFSNAQTFYEQLVARRMALKATADKAVTDATADGGTAPKNLTDAVAAAQKALDAANKSKADLDALFADEDNPTVALITELLKTGGNDGQALVDAISSTYKTAAGAADAAREIVDELTGEGGQVAMNTADIEELDGRVTQNESDIADNTAAIAVNAGMIATNAENIATNATNIATNTAAIETNAADIMTNAGNIAMNNTYIMENRGMIGANTAAIAAQSSRIDANVTAIRELREDMSGGIAAAMALAGMPEIGDRGVAVGGGSYDGESAIAVGVHFSGENSRFKAAITSGGGETGVSIGAGWSF